MNSRIYESKTLLKRDMVVKKPFLSYKIGDIVEVYDNSVGYFVYVYKEDCLKFIEEHFYTQAEWRDIQINSILED